MDLVKIDFISSPNQDPWIIKSEVYINPNHISNLVEAFHNHGMVETQVFMNGQYFGYYEGPASRIIDHIKKESSPLYKALND